MMQKIYSGRGIKQCMDICKRYNLTIANSDLHIKDSSDLNSAWRIVVKK